MQDRSNSLRIDDLAELLKARRSARGLGLRAAAEEAGVSFNTWSRVERGYVPDIETFSRLARWVGHSPADFLGEGRVVSMSTPDLIEAHLRGDPALSDDAAERIAGLVREFYDHLAHPAEVAVACHLRAASTFKPEASVLLADILQEMHDTLMAED